MLAGSRTPPENRAERETTAKFRGRFRHSFTFAACGQRDSLHDSVTTWAI